MIIKVGILCFSSPCLREELAPQTFVPFDLAFRSISNASLNEIDGDAP